jgi:hypothetical protein
MPGTDSSFLSWLRLLQHQRARGRTGLTIPSLIGAVGATDRADCEGVPDSVGVITA